jgi:serine/threonine protein kinase/WD40 repeat protein
MQEQSVFIEALEKQDPAERTAYLDRACAGDPYLRQRIERLLARHGQADEFLDAPGPAAAALHLGPPHNEGPGGLIGPYKLLEQIGEGGFGLVFMAEQQRPVRRKVALKLIKPGMDTRQVIARFEAERQALALMDHPHIARVLDAGATDAGLPFFVMELVRGIAITDFADQNSLSTRQRLELFVAVCQAVQHAHTKGIIHRDLKPSNVLVTLHDGVPVVKVIDFGIAKALGQQLTDKTLFTAFAQMLGTPLYMSPEQAELSALDVDTRSDVYALGVLLYELLTGTTPFETERLRQASLDEVRRIIREEEPPRPSTRLSTLGPAAATVSARRQSDPRRLGQLFRGELDWIVMRAMEKDRKRRYDSASALASDVERFLHDEPVLACPPSLAYRLGKLGRKNGKLLATTVAMAALLVTVAVVASLAAWRLSEEQAATAQQLDETRKAEEQGKHQLYRSLVAQARANRLSRRPGRRVRSLEILAEATRLARDLGLPENDFLELRNETIACLPLVDLRVARTWEGYPAGTEHVVFDADLERYVRVDWQGHASIRRVADDAEVCRLSDFGDPRQMGPVLSPDGRFLGRQCGPVLKVWRVTNQPAELLLAEPGTGLAFSPDSRRLATGLPDGTIRIYELPSARKIQEWKTAPSPSVLVFHPARPQLAVRHPGRITILDLDTGRKLADFASAAFKWDSLEWHPDGKRLASPGTDRRIHLWHTGTGKPLDRLAGHTNDGILVTINPAGDLLASSSWDGTLHLWEAGTGRELFKTPWDRPGYVCRFSRSGRWLAADVADRQLRLWEVTPARGYQTLVREPPLGKTEHRDLAVSGQGPLLAVGTRAGIGLWELPSGRPLAWLPVGDLGHVGFDPSGALVASGRGGQMRWPIEAVRPAGTLRLGPAQTLPLPWSSNQIVHSRDGRVMASAQFWGALVRHADRAGRLIPIAPQHDVRFVAVSADGRWVATGSHWTTDVFVKVWDASSGRHIADLPVQRGSQVGFSPDNRWLLTTGGGYRLWAVGTWREGAKIGDMGGPHAFGFSPDGKILAVETGSGAIRLIAPDTGREYARLEDPSGDRAWALTFGSDGSQLLAATNDYPAVHAWDLRAIRAELARRGLDWDLPPYPAAQATQPLRLLVDPTDPFKAVREARVENERAWAVVASPTCQPRDAATAVGLAQKAVELAPGEGTYWNTLGVAQYRAGRPKEAIAALTRALDLMHDQRESLNTLFLAMAHWQLGDKNKASQWYARAVRWMEQNRQALESGSRPNEELRRFRAEAEDLIGMKKE